MLCRPEDKSSSLQVIPFKLQVVMQCWSKNIDYCSFRAHPRLYLDRLQNTTLIAAEYVRSKSHLLVGAHTNMDEPIVLKLSNLSSYFLLTDCKSKKKTTKAPVQSAVILTVTLYALSLLPYESNKYPVLQLLHMPKFHCSMNSTFRLQYSGCTICSVSSRSELLM